MSYIVLLVLLALSFFFSGTETALTAISLPLLNGRAENGDKKAKILMEMKQKPDTLLGTLLLGNNIVNIALTALSTSLLIMAFGPHWGVWISTFLVSFIVLIFAEILPKTYAMRMTTSVAFAVAWPLYILIAIFAPIVRGLNWISRQALKILPRPKSELPAEEIAKEELRGTLSLQEKKDVLRCEKGMLSGVLDLSEVTLGDILVDRSRVSSLSVDAPIPEILENLTKNPYSRIPLFKGRRDNVVGILHIKKALKLKSDFEKNKHLDILEYCTKPHFVLNTVAVLDQLTAFRRHRDHFAIVVNEYGDVLGVVTLQDILEEIVGDMSDDTIGTKPASVNWTLLPDGTYRLNGNATIRDINRAFHWDLPDENAATLAGLLMYFTEKIPEEGQQFNLEDWTFTVAQRDKNRLTKIDILPPKEEKMIKKYAQICFLLEELGPFAPRLEKIRQLIQQPDFKYDQKAGAEILENIFLHSSYWLRLDLFDEDYLYKNDPQNLLPIQKLHLQMVDIGVSLLNKGFPLEFKPERYTQKGPDIIAPYAKAFSEQCHKRHAFLNGIKEKRISSIQKVRD